MIIFSNDDEEDAISLYYKTKKNKINQQIKHGIEKQQMHVDACTP